MSPTRSERLTIEYRMSAPFDEVTRDWTDDEKQALRDGSEEAQEEAAAAMMRMPNAFVDDFEVEL